MLISIFLILSEIHIISKDVLAVFYIPSTLFFLRTWNALVIKSEEKGGIFRVLGCSKPNNTF